MAAESVAGHERSAVACVASESSMVEERVPKALARPALPSTLRVAPWPASRACCSDTARSAGGRAEWPQSVPRNLEIQQTHRPTICRLSTAHHLLVCSLDTP